jgi:catechol 2,3-dioxygenase-like lactoylglutathione lyase family enzyme
VKLLRAATLTVANLARSEALYRDWLYYDSVEEGVISADLAASWGTPASVGKPYVVMQPKSGAEIYLRFVEDDAHPDYQPLKTYGWAAIEICVEDVLKVNERMLESPFKIRSDLEAYDLPRATSLIDRQFIHVCAVSDLTGTLNWCQDKLGLSFGRDMAIVYTMLANAFGVPYENKFTIATLTHERDVFYEFDQLPPAASARPAWKGRLPQGVAISTIIVPDFEERVAAHSNWLIAPPAKRDGPIYKGKRAATMRGPDGILFELVEI